MRRLSLIAAIAAVVMLLAAPTALAADPGVAKGDRVLLAFNGDVTVPAGEQADFVLVTGGTATVAGDVTTVVVFDGKAVLQGATVKEVFVSGGSLSIDAREHRQRRRPDLEHDHDGGSRRDGRRVRVVGRCRSPRGGRGHRPLHGAVPARDGAGDARRRSGAGGARARDRSVRPSRSSAREPGETILFGLAGLVVIPLVAILAMITVIGAPLGLAILLMVWPAAAIAGYLVAGIWIGEWLLYRGATERPERPYLAAVLGLIVLQVISLVPFVGAIASLFGFGAVLLLAWRIFRQPSAARPVTTRRRRSRWASEP